MADAKPYRSFLRRESNAALYKYRSHRLTLPTLVLFGTADSFVPTQLLAGFEPYADHMSIDFVPDCGHFIVEERTELVTQRALEFFPINESR